MPARKDTTSRTLDIEIILLPLQQQVQELQRQRDLSHELLQLDKVAVRWQRADLRAKAKLLKAAKRRLRVATRRMQASAKA